MRYRLTCLTPLLVGDGRRTTTVRAAEDSVLLAMDISATKHLMNEYPSAASSLLRLMLDREGGLDISRRSLPPLAERAARGGLWKSIAAAGGRVVFGSTVDLEDEDSGAAVTYQIVGDDEADLKLGLISISSPIARALIGKEAGDVAEVHAPGGVRHYEIVGVRYL